MIKINSPSLHFTFMPLFLIIAKYSRNLQLYKMSIFGSKLTSCISKMKRNLINSNQNLFLFLVSEIQLRNLAVNSVSVFETSSFNFNFSKINLISVTLAFGAHFSVTSLMRARQVATTRKISSEGTGVLSFLEVVVSSFPTSYVAIVF